MSFVTAITGSSVNGNYMSLTQTIDMIPSDIALTDQPPLYPSADLGGRARYRAAFLINGYYSALYGAEIRNWTPVVARKRIVKLQRELRKCANNQLRLPIVRTIRDFERICAFQEILR